MKRILFFILINFNYNVFCQTNKPNIVIIYADDMGYSDVGFYGQLYNTPSPANTPRMDSFASEAKVFTNAHSSSGVCTPSRYAILTGTYNWRTLPSNLVVSGAYGAPLIPDSDTTIAEYLKSKGYTTAAFGKWHLGGSVYNRSGVKYTGHDYTNITNPNSIDWERPIEGHALDHGFDVFKGKHNAINRPPHLYVDGNKFQYYDAVSRQYRDALNTDTYNWLSPTLSRAGLGDPSYDVYDVEPKMITEVETYIQEKSSQSEPFFAYVALNSPHKPWVVTPNFIGNTSFTYGDFMSEVDHRIGRIIDAIDNNGLKNNTIVIISSDNGPENTAMQQSLSNGKDSNGPFKGIKRDSWEGGTRVPFMIRWPGIVEGNTITSQLIWQGDIFKTLADYFEDNLPNDIAPDGVSILSILNGNKNYLYRDAVVSASIDKQLSIQTVDGWKLIDGTKAGGGTYSYDHNNFFIDFSYGIIGGTPKQLFYLPTDIGESNNIIETNKDIGLEMMNALNRIREGSIGVPFPGFTLKESMILTMNTQAYMLGDTTIPLPFVSGSYDVDFGNDGTFELVNQTGEQIVNVREISGYEDFTPGQITLAIRANSLTNPEKELQIQFFDVGADNMHTTADDIYREPYKLTNIKQWGNINWTSMKGAFGGCKNMTFNPSTNEYSDIESPILEKVEDMSLMFFRASNFNYNIGNWDITSITNMSEMLFEATAFSSTNYDLLLQGWSIKKVQPNVHFGAPPTTFYLSKNAKLKLTNPLNNWIITGDLGENKPSIPDITFANLSVFLQGPYNNSLKLMNDHLRTKGLIPAMSPYRDQSTVNTSVFNKRGNNAIVDWVLIELRDELDITNILYSKSGLLQRNGNIVGTDGISPLIIYDITDLNKKFYVTVSHRNHISISSNVPINFNQPPSINLTSTSNVMGTSNALAKLDENVYGMLAGSTTGSNNIQITDFLNAIIDLGKLGYNNKDTDLNGNVEVTDLIDLIVKNLGKSKQF